MWRIVVAFALGMCVCASAAVIAKPPTLAVPAVEPPPVLAVLPSPPLPVRDALKVGLGSCVPVLEAMSRQALTGPYDVQSGWSRADPTHHVFQSVAVLDRHSSNPPDGLAAIIAAPVTAGGCDGVAVQIFPLAGDCPTAQTMILQGGRTIAPLMGSRIMQQSNGQRVFLLPGFANTCIAVSVDSQFGAR